MVLPSPPAVSLTPKPMADFFPRTAYAEKKRRQLAAIWDSLLAVKRGYVEVVEVEVGDEIADGGLTEELGDEEVEGGIEAKQLRSELEAEFRAKLEQQRRELEAGYDEGTRLLKAEFRANLEQQKRELDAGYDEDRRLLEADYSQQKRVLEAQVAKEKSQISAQCADQLLKQRNSLRQEHEKRYNTDMTAANKRYSEAMNQRDKVQVSLEECQEQLKVAKQALTQIQVTAVDSLPLVSLVWTLLYMACAVSLVYWNASQFKDTNGTLLDALYFVSVSVGTVGFGDIIPKSVWMILFTDMLSIFWRIVPYILEYFVSELAQSLYLRWLSTVESRRWRSFYLMLAAVVVVVVVLLTGIVGIYFCEWDRLRNDFPHHSDAQRTLLMFHLTVMTMTTVGYGDITFGTASGRFFATLWIPFSTTFCTVALSVFIASFLRLISG